MRARHHCRRRRNRLLTSTMVLSGFLLLFLGHRRLVSVVTAEPTVSPSGIADLVAPPSALSPLGTSSASPVTIQSPGSAPSSAPGTSSPYYMSTNSLRFDCSVPRHRRVQIELLRPMTAPANKWVTCIKIVNFFCKLFLNAEKNVLTARRRILLVGISFM